MTPLQATNLWKKVAREWAQDRVAQARAHHPTTRIRIRRAVERRFREDEWQRLTLSPPTLQLSGAILTTTTSAVDNAMTPSHIATANPFLCAPAWFRLPTPTAQALRQHFPEEVPGGQLYCMTGPKPKISTTTTSTTGVPKKKTTKKPWFPGKKRRTRQGRWYLTEDEDGYRRRVTQEEEFRLIAQGQAPPP